MCAVPLFCGEDYPCNDSRMPDESKIIILSVCCVVNHYHHTQNVLFVYIKVIITAKKWLI